MCALILLEMEKQEDPGNKETQANVQATNSGRYACLWTRELESGCGMSQEPKGIFVCPILAPALAFIGSW